MCSILNVFLSPLLLNVLSLQLIGMVQIEVGAQEFENPNQKLYLQLFTEVDTSRKSFLEGDQISVASEGCKNGSFFYSLNPNCQRAVKTVANLLLAQKSDTGLLTMARDLQGHPVLHPKVWYTALTTVTLIRPDLRGLYKPDPVDVMPDAFISAEAIEQAQNLRRGEVRRKKTKACIVLDERFGQDNQIENRLWYFREDIQVNSQHWFWHIGYPSDPPNYIYGDRRGELFLYYHHFMMQRYNTERLANGLRRTVNFQLRNGFVMDEGYNPHLTDSLSGRNWGVRLPSTPMPEAILDGTLTLNTTLVWRDRLLKSIDQGTYTYPNRTEPIKASDGTNQLGDITESSEFSLNRAFYGSVHGNTHIMISAVNDQSMEKIVGIMSDSTVSMRDPMFYRWHSYIDDFIYDRYQRTLPPYQPTTGDHPLISSGVKVTNIEVIPTSPNLKDTLRTFWSLRHFNLTRRLDMTEIYSSSPPLQICAKHLNHEQFRYHVVVLLDDKSTSGKNATVRIYLAPRYSESGKRFTMDEQRLLFFPMDTFTTTLKPGVNNIWRNSSESTLTIPWGQSLGIVSQPNAMITKPLCGCGWPEHLLLPKGTASGMAFDLVVMITDGTDRVPGEGSSSCQGAPNLCGRIGQKYPDLKPMGYPFDRSPFKVTIAAFPSWWSMTRPINDLDEYVGVLPNMATKMVYIITAQLFTTATQATTSPILSIPISSIL